MFTDEILSNICKYVPAPDLVNWRLVSKFFKRIADARLVGPCMMYKTNAELRAAKRSVSLFTARELALALREAQKISGDIATFINTLIPLTGYDRIQRIGARYDTDQKISCIFEDARDRERPWRDLTEEDCEDEYGIAYVHIFINTSPTMKFCISLFPTSIDEWSASIEVGNVRINLPDQHLREIRLAVTNLYIEPINKFQSGDYLALVANVELVRLAYLHEGMILIRPAHSFSDATKHVDKRVYNIVGLV